MDFLYKVFNKSNNSEEIQPTPSVTKQCILSSEERIRNKLNLFNNSIEVYLVTCLNIYDTYTGFDDIVSLEAVYWDRKDANDMISEINIIDPSVVDGGKSDLYFQVMPIEIGIKISGDLYIITKLKGKHKLITLDKILYSLDNDLKLKRYGIYKTD
tara:strand:+ start:383 stop:850 length:468 start_codon:yes stop_codon:yes gene_type:complete